MIKIIKIVDGNILQAPENIISHQVNCMSVMGGGIAKQIKRKYPNVYEEYKNYLSGIFSINALGACQIVKAEDNKYIANLFGQHKYGRDKQYTDYKALEEALFSLKVSAKDHNLSVAIPFNIGCGLAGGSWETVYKIIEEVFEDYDVTLYRWEV